jgi:hypothetical protein
MKRIRWKVISGTNAFTEDVEDVNTALQAKLKTRAPLQVSEIDGIPWDRFACSNRRDLDHLCHKLKTGESLLGNQLMATRAKLNGESLVNMPAAATLETIGLETRSFTRKQHAGLGRAALERAMDLAHQRGTCGPSVFMASDWTGHLDLDEPTLVKLLATATPSTFGAMTSANLFDLISNAAQQKQPWKLALLGAVYGPQVHSLSLPRMKLDELLVRGLELSGQKPLLDDVRQLIAHRDPPDLGDTPFAQAAKAFRESQASRVGLIWKGIHPVGAFEVATDCSLTFHNRRRAAAEADIAPGIGELANGLEATSAKVHSRRRARSPEAGQSLLL